MSSFAGTPCDAVTELAKHCDLAALGLGSVVHVSESTNIAAIPAVDANTNTVSTDITMDATKVFFPWRIVDTDVEFSSTAIGAKGSQSLRNVLTIFIPVRRESVDLILNNALNDEFIMLFTDKLGERRIFGEEFAPAMIAEGGVAAVINNERNGTLLTFEYVGPAPKMYTGAVPLT